MPDSKDKISKAEAEDMKDAGAKAEAHAIASRVGDKTASAEKSKDAPLDPATEIVKNEDGEIETRSGGDRTDTETGKVLSVMEGDMSVLDEDHQPQLPAAPSGGDRGDTATGRAAGNRK
jgi:hypothetical protein